MLVILILVLDVNSDIFKYPVDYSGDTLQVLMFFKMIINGDLPFYSYATSHYVGLPFGFISADYPSPMATGFLFVKLLSMFTSNVAVVFNMYLIISYFMIINVMFFVLKRLRINSYLALTIALLYSLIPFHHFRISHTWYVNYFLLPIAVYYLLLLWRSKPLFFIKKAGEEKYTFDFSRRNLIIIAILIFFSLWNFYYSFFFVLLATGAAISAAHYRRNRYHFFSGIVMIFFITAPFIINLIPYQLYQYEHGKNTQVAHRLTFEAEIYGLKIAQMVLPIDGHNNAFLAKVKKTYNMAPLIGENRFSTLGIIGSLGFMIMIFYMLFDERILTVIKKLSILNFTAVIIATIGGFSSLFALIVTPQIRGYNRISIFIATMALFVVAIILNELVKKYSLKWYSNLFIALLILSVGIYDQVPSYFSYSKAIKAYRHIFVADREFVQAIEEELKSSKNKMVFQYPHMSSPESHVINKLGEYRQVVGFLHSDTIKWSFGGIKGRESDAWIKKLQKLPLEKQIDILRSSGFDGIWVDLRGYKDGGKEIESNLSRILGTKPIVSHYKTRLFYKMKPTGNKIYDFTEPNRK